MVVHLTASVETCLTRIKKRARVYEKGISAEYLKSLVEAYNYFFYHYRETPLLVVETNEIHIPAGPRLALEAGVTAIIQPGGSKRDQDVVDAVERSGATMVFTGRRHFRH